MNSSANYPQALKNAANTKLSSITRMQYNDTAAAQISSKPNTSINRIQLYEVAKIYYNLNNYKKFYRALKTLKSKSEMSKDTIMTAKSHHSLGTFYYTQSSNDSAYYHYLRAEKLYLKVSGDQYLSNLYIDIANIQYMISDYIDAEIYAYKVLRCEAVNAYDRYRAHNLIGNIQCSLKDFPKANQSYRKALDIATKDTKLHDNLECSAVSINNIGNAYKEQGRYNEAIIYFKQALQSEAALRTKFPHILAVIKDNLGYSLLKTRQLGKASKYFQDALKIENQYDLKQESVTTLLHLAKFHAGLADTAKAFHYARQAQIIAKEVKLPTELLSCYETLSYYDKNNFQYYTTEYFRISDSLKLHERRMRNKFARIAYETEDLIKEKKTAVTQKWIISTAAAVVVFLISLLLLIKSQNAKQRALVFANNQQLANESIYRLINERQGIVEESRKLEKKRIARELHDGIMNKLASTRLNLFILNKKHDDETIDKCITLITNIHEIENEVRQVANDLTTDLFLGNNNFKIILDELFQEQQTDSETSIRCLNDPTIKWDTIGGAVKINIYRILQEALSNCRKHSKAKHISVSMLAEAEALKLTIHDDGKGFNTTIRKPGIGLTNMAERIKTIDGEINISSGKGGTTVSVSIPIKHTSLDLMNLDNV
jgi:signal transduction histidine kinase